MYFATQYQNSICKKNDEFYSVWDYSTFCKNEAIIQYENKGDIEVEINNYKNMKNPIINI